MKPRSIQGNKTKKKYNKTKEIKRKRNIQSKRRTSKQKHKIPTRSKKTQMRSFGDIHIRMIDHMLLLPPLLLRLLISGIRLIDDFDAIIFRRQRIKCRGTETMLMFNHIRSRIRRRSQSIIRGHWRRLDGCLRIHDWLLLLLVIIVCAVMVAIGGRIVLRPQFGHIRGFHGRLQHISSRVRMTRNVRHRSHSTHCLSLSIRIIRRVEILWVALFQLVVIAFVCMRRRRRRGIAGRSRARAEFFRRALGVRMVRGFFGGSAW